MERVGLILQGGGTRGVYTSGVVDFLLDKKLYFSYVIGVSSGACNGAAYVSQQRGYGKIMHIKYVNDSRYMGLMNLLRKGSYFGLDFIFDELPNTIEKFDFRSFASSNSEFYVVATNCRTGKPQYFEKKEATDILNIIKASCSLPFITKMVEYQGNLLLDGGICDPIPIEKSISDGNKKNVVILTVPLQYPTKNYWEGWGIGLLKYRKYQELIKSLQNSHGVYCKKIDLIKQLEKNNRAFIISPTVDLKVGVLENNKQNLEDIYLLGYNDAKKSYPILLQYLS
ncbi:patatin family protein [Alkaliphilus pronyensis]|uniref:Patatin family protein n=1 Tax=Alkaliphilus pronyensis TaxID=1482732 RepID=A0A6I0F6S6_9FIRM|nr:patatin family protein [Alkaliphilus pronyensis]KAB3535739.1 patatin family protein [Alkaliphilus pronyensis]